MKTDFDDEMTRCIELAQEAARAGNYALGALVVLNGDIITETGSSLVGDNNDPSAHPEMMAIRCAAQKLQCRYLTGAYLVTTLEPCPMCTSVAIWAKMAGIVFGATQEDAMRWSAQHPDEIFTWRQIGIPAHTVIDAGTPTLDLHPGVMRDECNKLFALNDSRNS